MALSRPKPAPPAPRPVSTRFPRFELGQFAAVAIGSSTGGPNLVQAIVTALPADLPVPLFIAQHLPPAFTESFAATLARESPLAVFHAEDGMPALPGAVYLGRGHQHMRVLRKGAKHFLEISPEPKALVFRPSADELLASCAAAYAGRALGIVMTGIGRDGVVGAAKLVAAGGTILTQTRETCAVYGMPRACDEAGLSTASLTPDDLRLAILQLAPSQHDLVHAKLRYGA